MGKEWSQGKLKKWDSSRRFECLQSHNFPNNVSKGLTNYLSHVVTNKTCVSEYFPIKLDFNNIVKCKYHSFMLIWVIAKIKESCISYYFMEVNFRYFPCRTSRYVDVKKLKLIIYIELWMKISFIVIIYFFQYFIFRQ